MAGIVAVLANLPAPASGDVLAKLDYDGHGTLHATFQEMDFTVDAIGPPEVRGPRLLVSIGGAPAFRLQLKGESGNASATVKVAQLAVGGPQVVFQHFTFGAHCCQVLKIATRVDGHWVAVFGGSFDGDGAPELKDVDGDGFLELVSIDQSFLYAFSGYAGSYAPILIQKLERAQLVDVTRDARCRDAVRQSLDDMQPKTADDDLWHQNGFLGGWVATKVLLGEGPSAWARMLKTYNTHDDWSMEGKTFPEALRAHLIEHHYISETSGYPLPTVGARQ